VGGFYVVHCRTGADSDWGIPGGLQMGRSHSLSAFRLPFCLCCGRRATHRHDTLLLAGQWQRVARQHRHTTQRNYGTVPALRSAQTWRNNASRAAPTGISGTELSILIFPALGPGFSPEQSHLLTVFKAPSKSGTLCATITKVRLLRWKHFEALITGIRFAFPADFRCSPTPL